MSNPMGSEHALWRQVRDRLGEYGLLMRVENTVMKGMPDLHYALYTHASSSGRYRKMYKNRFDDQGKVRKPAHSMLYGQGWIELKHVKNEPVRETTPVRYKWQSGQMEWLRDYWELGGHAYVLAQVGRRYILHSGWAPHKIGAGDVMPMLDLLSTARYTWEQPWRDKHTYRLLSIFTAWKKI